MLNPKFSPPLRLREDNRTAVLVVEYEPVCWNVVKDVFQFLFIFTITITVLFIFTITQI